MHVERCLKGLRVLVAKYVRTGVELHLRMSNFGSHGQLWRVAAVRKVAESVQAGPLAEVAPLA